MFYPLKLKWLFSLCILMVSQVLSAQNEGNPVNYLQYFNNQYQAINAKNMEYLQYNVHSDNINSIEQKRAALINQVNESLRKTKALPPFGQDTTLKSGMINILHQYQEAFQIDFKNVNILKQNSLESFETLEAYYDALEKAETKLEDNTKAFVEIQEAFAQKNNIKLVTTGSDELILELNELNQYYRNVFKQFFKVSKANATFTNALQKEDAEKMEDARGKLLKICEEEITKLEETPPYKEDSSYKDAVLEYAKMSLELSNNQYKKVVEVTKKKQSGAQLTQEDVNTFNKVVEIFNTKFMEMTNQANLKGSELLKNNIPKPIETSKI